MDASKADLPRGVGLNWWPRRFLLDKSQSPPPFHWPTGCSSQATGELVAPLYHNPRLSILEIKEIPIRQKEEVFFEREKPQQLMTRVRGRGVCWETSLRKMRLIGGTACIPCVDISILWSRGGSP